MQTRFDLEDAAQIFVGAFALGAPISFSEEAWRLANTLPTLNFVLLICLSVFFLGLYAYENMFERQIAGRKFSFVVRVSISYLITMVVIALVLLCLNKLPLLSEPLIAFKRILIISMPASMGAIVVDSFDKE